MKYRVFYSLLESPDPDVDASTPVTMDSAEIYSRVFGGLSADGDFFGMVDEHGNILQAMYEQATDRYWFEIPVESERGSWGRHYTVDEAVEIMKNLPATFSRQAFPGFRFESWDGDEIIDG